VGFVAVEVVEFAHAISRDLKRKEIGAVRRATLGTGVPFLLSFFFLPVGARLLLGHGPRKHPTRHPQL
jgi:hypothetical protein